MAMTHAEHQRRYREKKRLEMKKAEDHADAYLRSPFSAFWTKATEAYDSDWAIADEQLASVGIAIPAFETDDDPLYAEFHGEDTDGYRASIGKAERAVDAMIVGAQALAKLINRYKREEIEARIAELEAADMTDPAAKKQALADIVRLTKIKDRLEKEVRFSFPVIEIKG